MLEKLASLIYHRRWAIVIFWAVLTAVTAPLALQADRFLVPGGFVSESFPSVQAAQIFEQKLDSPTFGVEILFYHPELTAYDDGFISGVLSAIEPLKDYQEVTSVDSHLDNPQRVSTDGHTVVASVGLSIPLEESVEFTQRALSDLDSGELETIVTGGPPLYRDLSVASSEDLRRGEIIALPLATVALLVVFGTLTAAVMPVAVGGAGTALGLSALFLVSLVDDVSIFSLNIASILGIGLGIDYSLFYTSRFKEELALGRTVRESIVQSHKYAGPAILFSAATSMIGLTSLFLFELNVLRSMGIGAILVIIAALLAAFTLLPAILSIVGHKINRLSVGISWARSDLLWSPLSRWVMRRPLLVLIPTASVLLLMAFPLKDIRLGALDANILPDSYESRQGFNIIQEEFGVAQATQIVAGYSFEGDPFDPLNIVHLYDYGAALEDLPGVTNVISFVNLDSALGPDDYALLYSLPESVADGEAAQLLRTSVRQGFAVFVVEADYPAFSPEAQRLSAEVSALHPESGQTYITGGPPGARDLIGSLYSVFPWAALAVICITYVSLLILFRSLVLPLKAVLLNVLSIAASYGALVFVFQQGNFSGLLDFQSAGVVEATTPIVLFAILFGLSMDYEIFLLARVSESYRKTGNNTEAVAQGLRKSGLIITGAASILIIVASAFVLADVLVVQMIGFGLALAIFIDVTLVRALAAPAIMRLAGKWNWYLPRRLDRILPKWGDVA